jgi:hypothetical protein
MKLRFLTALAALSLGACATARLSPEQLERSDVTLRAAEEAGAQIVPPARLRLQTAKAERKVAEQMAAAGNPRAPKVLDHAIIDAQVAQALAQSAVSAALIRAASDGLLVPATPENDPEETP